MFFHEIVPKEFFSRIERKHKKCEHISKLVTYSKKLRTVTGTGYRQAPGVGLLISVLRIL